MAKEKAPEAIDTSDAALNDIPNEPPAGLTFEQMLELFKAAAAGQSQGSAAEVAQAMAKAQIEAADFLADRDRKERHGPNVSVFNPKGERDHPRPRIQGEIFWLGTKLHEEELVEAEITLLNLLKPGLYHGGQWKVTDQAQGTGARNLLIFFPNEEADDRTNLPPSMVAMLEEMVGAAATPVLA